METVTCPISQGSPGKGSRRRFHRCRPFRPDQVRGWNHPWTPSRVRCPGEQVPPYLHGDDTVSRVSPLSPSGPKSWVVPRPRVGRCSGWPTRSVFGRHGSKSSIRSIRSGTLRDTSSTSIVQYRKRQVRVFPSLRIEGWRCTWVWYEKRHKTVTPETGTSFSPVSGVEVWRPITQVQDSWTLFSSPKQENGEFQFVTDTVPLLDEGPVVVWWVPLVTSYMTLGGGDEGGPLVRSSELSLVVRIPTH